MRKEKESLEYSEKRVLERNEYPGYSLYRQKTLTKFDAFDLEQAYDDGWERAREKTAGIQLTREILEKSGFKDCKVLNLSPDMMYENEEYTVCVTLRPGCDTNGGISISRKSDRLFLNLEVDRHKGKSLTVDQLQGLLDYFDIDLEIVV